jgi:hypothetical protein
MPLGVNLQSHQDTQVCDIITLKAGDDADVLNSVYEANSVSAACRSSGFLY